MEEEAEKLKELQNEVEKQMNMSPPPGNGETPPAGQGAGGHPQISGCSPPDPPVSVFFLPFCAAGPVIMSLEEKMEADARSIYVGNVSWGGDDGRTRP